MIEYKFSDHHYSAPVLPSTSVASEDCQFTKASLVGEGVIYTDSLLFKGLQCTVLLPVGVPVRLPRQPMRAQVLLDSSAR